MVIALLRGSDVTLKNSSATWEAEFAATANTAMQPIFAIRIVQVQGIVVVSREPLIAIKLTGDALPHQATIRVRRRPSADVSGRFAAVRL